MPFFQYEGEFSLTRLFPFGTLWRLFTGLGHLAVQIAAKGMGMRVIGIDHPSKEDLVKEMGAEHFIDFTKSKDTAADVKALTDGLGAKAVLVLNASNQAYAE